MSIPVQLFLIQNHLKSMRNQSAKKINDVESKSKIYPLKRRPIIEDFLSFQKHSFYGRLRIFGYKNN